MSTMSTLKTLTIKQLRPAKYNPRTITESRLKKLMHSVNTFGDLSGVVYNVRTGNLVSGHQRMKTISKTESKIVQKDHKDKLGTIAIGHIESKGKDGVAVQIPFRAVDWDLNREKAANIAANAHGGDFDKDKLALVIADLEKNDVFDLDAVGLDPLTLKTLKLPKMKDVERGKNAAADRDKFKEYGADLHTDHECPRCKYRW